MKYRTLSLKELEPFKNDFIKFLSINTITGQDWNKIKTNQPNRAKKILSLFSDLVWEKSLENIRFLEHRDHKHIKVFDCGEKKMSMIGFSVNAKSAPSLLNEKTFQKIGSGELLFSSFNPEFIRSEHIYKQSRCKEVYLLIERGCFPCEENYFLGIKSLLK